MGSVNRIPHLIGCHHMPPPGEQLQAIRPHLESGLSPWRSRDGTGIWDPIGTVPLEVALLEKLVTAQDLLVLHVGRI